jgi:hypothetical protein
MEVRIASFVPGRVRLKIDRVRTDAQFADQLRTWVPQVPGIRSLQLNEATGSVLIAYDPEKLSLQTLSSFVPELVPPGVPVEELETRLAKSAREGTLVWRLDSSTLLRGGLLYAGLRSLIGGAFFRSSLFGVLLGAGIAATGLNRSSGDVNPHSR